MKPNDKTGDYAICFDCSKCSFNRFMKLYGLTLNHNICWVNCTVKNHDKIELLFGMILENTIIDKDMNIIYTGNSIVKKEGAIAS